MDLPSIKVAKTIDNSGVRDSSQISVVSLDKKLNNPYGPIKIPKKPHKTAIGSPNLSNWIANFNLLPKINKKAIIKNPKILTNIESEKILLFLVFLLNLTPTTQENHLLLKFVEIFFLRELT